MEKVIRKVKRFIMKEGLSKVILFMILVSGLSMVLHHIFFDNVDNVEGNMIWSRDAHGTLTSEQDPPFSNIDIPDGIRPWKINFDCDAGGGFDSENRNAGFTLTECKSRCSNYKYITFGRLGQGTKKSSAGRCYCSNTCIPKTLYPSRKFYNVYDKWTAPAPPPPPRPPPPPPPPTPSPPPPGIQNCKVIKRSDRTKCDVCDQGYGKKKTDYQNDTCVGVYTCTNGTPADAKNNRVGRYTYSHDSVRASVQEKCKGCGSGYVLSNGKCTTTTPQAQADHQLQNYDNMQVRIQGWSACKRGVECDWGSAGMKYRGVKKLLQCATECNDIGMNYMSHGMVYSGKYSTNLPAQKIDDNGRCYCSKTCGSSVSGPNIYRCKNNKAYDTWVNKSAYDLAKHGETWEHAKTNCSKFSCV